MSEKKKYVDYYEVLEVSPNATQPTIERVFRFLAKVYHPDAAGSGDAKRFSLLVEACETLTDPDRRASFDKLYAKKQQENVGLVEETGNEESDCADRHRMLSLFYAQRRKDMKNPGIGVSQLEHIMGIPTEVLEFHLWYFREKGWIKREEAGPLSITCLGVDKIEDDAKMAEINRLKRITEAANRVGFAPGADAGVVSSPVQV